MAIVTISGAPGCGAEEVARITASRLRFELITESRIHTLAEEEFNHAAIPDRAFPLVTASVLAKLAMQYHLVVNVVGGETYFRQIPGVIRVQVVAPESRRAGTLMVERRIDRKAAGVLLNELDASFKAERKRRFGRGISRAEEFDVVFNTGGLDADHIAAMIEHSAEMLHLRDHGLLSAAAEAQVQFQMRLSLAKHGIAPPVGNLTLKRANFCHPSEEIFANLLDFYRIAWEYEPRSFPIAWDKDGKPLEFFTPDFYLTESDMYVELTTMKQAHVTKKNRKVKLLRTIYPNVNIQVFYQKDFQNLIFKHGLAADRAVQV